MLTRFLYVTTRRIQRNEGIKWRKRIFIPVLDNFRRNSLMHFIRATPDNGQSAASERDINFKHQEFRFNLMNENQQDAPLISRKLRRRSDTKSMTLPIQA